MTTTMIQKYCKLDAECTQILRATSEKDGYSARVIHKLLRLARTSADLAASDNIRPEDIRRVLRCRDLDVSNNNITDISVLASLLNVVRFDGSNNKVQSLPTFTKDHQLGALLMAYNDLENINALSVLANIYLVDIDYNARVKTLNPLKQARHLTKVNCFGTKVSEIPFPSDSGVVVNMDMSLLIN